MQKILKLDFETRGVHDIGGQSGVGLWNYFNHPLTRVLMMAYKLPGETKTKLWQPHLGPMPEEVRAALLDPEVFLEAFNSTFERYCLRFLCGIELPPERFIDPQVGARYLALPADLGSVCEILDVPAHLAKDKRGKDLIDLFCTPKYPRKKKGEPQGEPYFNDWNSHPAEWEAFCEYAKRDVDAEEEVYRRLEILGAAPLPPQERKLWELDQRINDRGILVDVDLVTKALKLAERSKKESLTAQNELTGLENANSTSQLLPWVQERGYPFNTLRKDTIVAVLKDPAMALTEECRKALTSRVEAGGTSYTKLASILRNVSSDGRLRNQFVFMGASRTGRFSGNSVQLQNFARPSAVFENVENLKTARELIRNEKYNEIKERFGSVLLTVKNCLRTVFITSSENRLNIADLASIETRLSAWLAQAIALMKVFELNKDAYLDFAAKMTGLPYDILYRDLKGTNEERKIAAKKQRQMAKPGLLGCVYQLGGGGWGVNQQGDKIKTGLAGYSEAMGVEMSFEQAHTIVRVFRESYPEIPQMWYQLEKCITDVLKGTNTVRKLGPNDCIVIDKLNIEGRDPLLRLKLPSGRYLHYLDAKMEMTKMPWEDGEGNEVWREALVYAGQNQTTKQWTRIPSRGGKIFENLIQAIARDIIGAQMLIMEERDLPVVLHAHDEAVCETPNDPFAPGHKEMELIMNAPIGWAPGLLLGSEGFESCFYRKG